MKRREFLKSGLLGAASMSTGLGLGLYTQSAIASHQGIAIPRTLAHIMLEGGADMRYVFVPHPGHDPAYVDSFWIARRSIYSQNYPDYASMYAAEYQTVTDESNNISFGIHNSCGWLAQQFNEGNVAIIANVFGSLNRRHDHSQIIVNTGDPGASRININHDGWGGRLAELTGSSSNVVSISRSVPVFCNGTNSNNRLEQVFHARDLRNTALPEIDLTKSPTDSSNIINRALTAYYKVRGAESDAEKPLDWPYHRFFNHFDSLQTFGKSVAERLSDHSVPDNLSSMSLNNPEFELQCHNLYDCTLVSDLIGLKVISMIYQGWDHHASLQTSIEDNLSDVFGSDGGLNTVMAQLSDDAPGASQNLVITFGSDFGRQLAANGSLGADHGRGSYSVMIGESVNGGTYGEMFPQREGISDPQDSLGRPPFEIPGQDIKGLTSFQRVLSQACNWATPGTGSMVFPNVSTSDIETGLDLSNLFST